MNRAARIMQAAKTGQVWASEDAWVTAMSDMRSAQLQSMLGQPGSSFTSTCSGNYSVGGLDGPDPFAGTPLGAFKMKGVQGEVSLVHCRMQDDVLSANPEAVQP